MTTTANEITGPNAGGPRQFPIPTPLTARVGQFHGVTVVVQLPRTARQILMPGTKKHLIPSA